jgi:hypothetical protein
MHINLAREGARVGFYLIISAFMLVMLLIGGGKLSIELALLSLLVCPVLTTAGELTLRVCRLTHIKAWLPMSCVVGFAVISVPMIALTLMVNLSALAAFFICALLVLVSFSLMYFGAKDAPARPAVSWADTVMTLVIAVAIGLLVRVPVMSSVTFMATGVLPIWSDYLLHGVTISAFGSPFATGTDMEWVGVNRIFYHFAPFMLPAAFQPVSGMSGLALSTALLLPLGLLIAAMGSYVLAVELGGRRVGLLAFAALLGLPASSFLVQSGWFDFHWMLFVVPGSGYAIGVAAAVCVAILADAKKNDGRVLALGLLLLFSLILIRVQMFMLLAPAVIALVVMHRWHLKPKLVAALALGMVVSIMLLLHFSTPLYALWLSETNTFTYLNGVIGGALLNGRGSPLGLVSSTVGLTMLFQVLLILVAVLGVYCVLYPLALFFSVRRFGFRVMDALPLFVLLSFIGLTLLAPAAYTSDITEYKQRHFLLLYVLVVVYTIYYAVSLVPKDIVDTAIFKRTVAAGAACILVGVVALNWGANPARPSVVAMSWASFAHNQPTTPGLLDSAAYIKAHASPGDVMVIGKPSVGPAQGTAIIDLISLTGVPAYAARARMTKSLCIQYILQNRLSVLKTLSAMDNWPDAQRFLQANGIRWVAFPAGGHPNWDTGLKAAAFSSKGMSVYDAGHSASDLFSKLQC